MAKATPTYTVNEDFVATALKDRETVVSTWEGESFTRGFLDGMDHVMSLFFNYYEDVPKPAAKPAAAKEEIKEEGKLD